MLSCDELPAYSSLSSIDFSSEERPPPRQRWTRELSKATPDQISREQRHYSYNVKLEKDIEESSKLSTLFILEQLEREARQCVWEVRRLLRKMTRPSKFIEPIAMLLLAVKRTILKLQAQISAPFRPTSLASEPQHRRISQRRVLPVLITSELHRAVPDTGSVDNVVSEEFARSLGATLLDRDIPEQYHNACGKTFDSKWTTSLPCAFPDEPASERMCEFSVVSGLAVPFIVGSRFLEITETLTKFKTRLVRVANKALTSWRLLHVQVPRRQLKCGLDGNTTFANADTGSNVDLISLEYAQRMKLSILKIPADISVVELADGTLRQLAGRVRCRFEAGDTGQTKTRRRTFYVLPGLTSDVLLGDDTLEEIDAFETHKNDFMDIEVEFNPVDLIYWAGNEGWPSMETLLNEANPNVASSASTNLPSATAQKKKSIFSFRKKRKLWKASEILGDDLQYERYVERVANWHERQKDIFDKNVSRLTGPEKDLAEQEELAQCQQYEELQERVRNLHEQRKAALRP